jgi:hypothetical protein
VLSSEGPKYKAAGLNLQHSRGFLTQSRDQLCNNPTAEIGLGRDFVSLSVCHVHVFLSHSDLHSERDENMKESFPSLSFHNKIFDPVNEGSC